MTRPHPPGVVHPSLLESIALVTACCAIGLAALAAPGGLVWLHLFAPMLGLPNEGVLSLLANTVTIPLAVLSWMAASTCCVTAVVALIRRRGRPRRVLLALTLGAPGALLGTALLIAVIAQAGSFLGFLPNSGDLRRQSEARVVAAHLQLPESGAGAISRCEGYDGSFRERRTIDVLERWNSSRLDQIRARLKDYSTTFVSGPGSLGDSQQIYYTGTDTHGNFITVIVVRYPAGTTLSLGLDCPKMTLRSGALRTGISLEN